MNFWRYRLQAQLLFSVFAALSVAALSGLLISEAVRTAERTVLADARGTLAQALKELARQYDDRVTNDPTWPDLPVEAQDLSLRAVARAVFRSYPGAEGGYVLETDDQSATPAEVGEVIRRAKAGRSASQVLSGGPDLIVVEAQRLNQQGVVAWTLKRLTGRNDPSLRQHQWLLAALALAALLSVGGALATSIGLRRGIAEIREGLASLEDDFSHSLHERHDDLGEISQSINRMAETRRQLEAELRREDRLRTIGRLAAGFAHEIRNPLNGIRLSMDMIERRLAQQTLRPSDLQMVRREVDRLNGLLTALLKFEHTKSAECQPQPILPLLQRCTEILAPQAEQAGVTLRLPATTELGAKLDAQRLMQALMNLLVNAIEAAGPSGSVGLTVKEVGSRAEITVCDDGPGLAPEQREHLFEAFYTTKPQGTGLGLAVSRELVTSMGGELRYEPAPAGRGACFIISLPLPQERYALVQSPDRGR